MNAYHLHKPDGSLSGYCACGECGQVALDGNLDLSEKCCTCYECGDPIPREERYARGILYHRECDLKRRKEIDRKALEAAEDVSATYEGPVYYEGGFGSFGDGYFANVNELAEWLDDQDPEDLPVRPTHAFCCEGVPFPGLDVDQLLESACEDLYEDAQDDLDGVAGLYAAVKAFNDANAGIVSYFEDRKRKVAIPEAQDAQKGVSP